MDDTLPPRIEDVLGRRVTAMRRAHGGYSIAYRAVVTLDDDTTAFVKAGTTPDIGRFLRREHEVYTALQGNAFLPRVLGFDDHDASPILLLEDLSGAHWPPPWGSGHVDRVIAELENVWRQRPPPNTPTFADKFLRIASWRRIADSPEAFLSTRVVPRDWLERALPDLIDAEASVDLGGEALLHCDVRSDNLCFDADRTLLIDWNWVCTGNERVDLVFWLPTLKMEGGPDPWDLMSGVAPEVALLAGYFAWNGSLPPPAGAPTVRGFQLAQLRVVLPWLCKELGLPGPGEAH